MILRTRRSTAHRRPDDALRLKTPYWVGLSALLGAAALSAPPQGEPAEQRSALPGSVPGTAPLSATEDEVGPDDDLIEFLGADDVGDAAWWEFLKKSTQRMGQPPVPPPQDAKQ